jgi:hypothetical protein
MSASEVQVISILNSPGSGKFALALDSVPTALMPYHPAAGELQGYLEALSNIGAGNVAITKDSNWVYRATFQNGLANTPLNQLQLWDNQLGGGGDVQITTATEGDAGSGDPKQDAINDAYYVLSRLNHRLTTHPWPSRFKAIETVLSELLPYITIPPSS